ncbi:DUF368 domain-containing protein [bacterium]|nr:DUF368 domain-containing protein [bacterium]
MNFKQAFMASPGPKSWKEAFILFLKGLTMGGADIIPGVSGGTMALITGIYEQLLEAIRSIDMQTVKHLLKGEISAAIAGVHIRFLAALLSGIAVAIISLARIMHYLLTTHESYTFGLFFGMIAASIVVIGRQVKWNPKSIVSGILGAVSAWLIVGLIPVETPTSLIFIMFSGFIAICAMILPGISGAFLLLIMGKYEFITGALKNPFGHASSGDSSLLIIFVFLIGAFFGITLFARFLKWLLSKYHTVTLAFLTGLMGGSMRRIWPWKGDVVTKMIREKVHVISESNVLPSHINTAFFVVIALMIVGFLVVYYLEKVSNK